MAQYLFFDTETTGINPKDGYGIWSISGMIVNETKINKTVKIIQRFDYKMNPGSNIKLSKFFFDNGPGREALKSYRPQWEVAKEFYEMLKFHHDNGGDKLIPIGYRTHFDIDHLFAWFKRNDLYFLSHCHSGYEDCLSHAMHLLRDVRQHMPNFKLETVCKLLNIEIDAHDSESDIQATYEIFCKFYNYVNK